jgi:signal transduction histidine kinase
VVGVAAIVLGVLLLARRALPLAVGETTIWPVAVAAFGLLLAWSSGKVDWSQPRELARAGGGLCLIAAGVIGFIALNFGRAAAPRALLLATGVLSLVVVIVAPWLWRAASQVGEQRLERLRAVERAELAAHLHDSVLQTLSLITRNADDAATTRQLARRQERELRQWLFGRAAPETSPESFRVALERVAAEVEDLHGVPIETVVVGDGAVDEAIVATLAAAREALVNASKHSGAPVIDLYGELGKGRLEVFVRDKGNGFEPAAVANDRRGLSESVVGRMQRAGGKASIVSRRGEGTEVALELPRGAVDDAESGERP